MRERHGTAPSWGLLVVAVAAVVAVALFLRHGEDRSHQVTVRFQDASGLVAGNQVRIAGVPAGSVATVAFATDPASRRQFAEVTVELDAAHWPLHAGTHFAIRPKGVLSDVFVDLQPGRGEVLGAEHVFDYGGGQPETASPVALDQLTNVLDSTARDALKTEIDQATVLFGDGGAVAVNHVLQQANPLTASLGPLTETLAGRVPELHRLNVDYANISGQLAREDANLRGVVENGATLLATLASQQQALQGTLDHAAGTLTTLDQGLSGETHNLQAVITKAPAALLQARQLADVLGPVITRVDPHIPNLDLLLQEFSTATGYGVNGVDSLRAAAFVGNKPTCAVGGQPQEQGGRTCPAGIPLPAGSAPSAVPGVPAGGDSGGGGGGAALPAATLPGQLGALFP